MGCGRPAPGDRTPSAALASMDVQAKAHDEFAPVADDDAERLLTRRLTDPMPGAVVVVEDACAADPTLLEGLGAAQAWMVDRSRHHKLHPRQS